MLNIKSKPIKLIALPNGNIIIVTNHQIIITSILPLQIFASFKIISAYPQSVTYSYQKSQILLYNSTAVQIFQVGKKGNIRMKSYFSLYQEEAFSICFGNDRWNLYGIFRQYNLKDLNFKNIMKIDEGIASCFCGSLQFILTPKKLVYYNHQTQQLTPIKWQKITEYTSKTSSYPLIMSASQPNPQHLILILNNVSLLLKNNEILHILEHKGKLQVYQSYLFCQNANKGAIVYQIKQNKFQKFAEMDNNQEQLKALFIIGQSIYLISYFFHVIHLRIKVISIGNHMLSEKNDLIQIAEQLIEAQINLNNNQLQNEINTQVKTQGKITQSLQQKIQTSLGNKTKTPEIPHPNSFPNQQFQYCQSQQQKCIQQISMNNNSHLAILPYESSEDMIPLTQSGQENIEIQNNRSDLEGSSEPNSELARDDEIKYMKFDPSASVILIETPYSDINTPAFESMELKMGDNWSNFQQNWKNIEVEQVIQQQDFGQQESEHNNRESKLSNEVYKNLIKYLKQSHKKEPDIFQEELGKNLLNLIMESESKLFFAEYVKLTHCDLTKDRLLRLYKNIPNTLDNRKFMTFTLGEFKLKEVPALCLSIDSQILKIYNKIYNTVYLQDLLSPTIHLYQLLLDNYFNNKFQTQKIYLQGEVIRLKYPRNLLNILLYLNDFYHLPLEDIFKVYVECLMKNNVFQTVRTIIRERIAAICQVKSSIYEQCAENISKYIIENQIQNCQQVECLLQFMSLQKNKLYREIINFIDYCRTSKIKYSIVILLGLNQNKNGMQFIREIINSNSPLSLAKIELKYLFRFINKIETLSELKSYTSEHLQISETLAEILMKSRCFKEAFLTLQPFSSVIDRYYLANLLIKYYNGRLINRLIRKENTDQQLFNEIFSIITSSNNEIKGDFITEDIPMKNKVISWESFKDSCEILEYSSEELCFILYLDLKFAKNLIQYNILSIDEYKQIQKLLGINKKSAQYDIFSSKIIRNPNKMLDLPVIPVFSSKNSHQMDQLLDSVRQIKNYNKISRMNSDKAASSENGEKSEDLHKSFFQREQTNDENLWHIKFQVDKDALIKILSKLYNQSSSQKFLSALNLIDKQRVGLKNIETIKFLISADINYDFKKIIPFQYFLQQPEQQQKMWLIIIKNIKQELTIENFWIIYLLVQILSGKGIEVIKLLIEKLIIYERQDDWAQLLQDILMNKNISGLQLFQYAQQAQERGLNQIRNILIK